MTDSAVIYVELVNEDVETWRPVTATREESGVYRLDDLHEEGEVWAFPPGSRVRCEIRELSGGSVEVACALAECAS